MIDQYGAWLEASCSQNPKVEEKLGKCRSLYSQKLWHELTDLIEEQISDQEFVKFCPLVDLYNNFIQGFASKINPLKLALFAVAASKEMVDPYDGQAFLQGVLDSLVAQSTRQGASSIDEISTEACLYLEMQIAQYHLITGNVETCKKLMDKGHRTLDSLSEVNHTVAAAVHYVTMSYYKLKFDYGAFYRSSLKYLSYTAQDSLSPEYAEAVAVDVCLAALLGEDVYNFGELIVHPIIQSLRNSDSFCWLYELLESFHQGDIGQYDHLCSVHAKVLNAQPGLVAHERRLREKITVLCLLSYVSSLPAEKKSVPLAEIGSRTKLPDDGVEFLLMKALSLHLIEGIIDQVNGSVSISWVAPRVMTIPEIEEFQEKLDAWVNRVDEKACDLFSKSAGIVA